MKEDHVFGYFAHSTSARSSVFHDSFPYRGSLNAVETHSMT